MKKAKTANKAHHLRMGRISAALVGVVILLIVADSIRRGFFMGGTTANFTIDGRFVPRAGDMLSASMGSGAGSDTDDINSMLMDGYKLKTMACSKMNEGFLVLPTDTVPAVRRSDMKMVDLNEKTNHYYSILTAPANIDDNAAAAFNAMMKAYSAATYMSDFAVCGTDNTYTDQGSTCPVKYPDSATNYTVDLAIYANGYYVPFDGMDEEGWVLEHCYEYGFIVRYPEGKENATGESFCPWHLRYVGKVHSMAMKEKNLCLEEYVEHMALFTADAPCIVTVDDVEYEVFTVAAEGDTVDIKIPEKGYYDISGTCRNSFIVSEVKPNNNTNTQ